MSQYFCFHLGFLFVYFLLDLKLEILGILKQRNILILDKIGHFFMAISEYCFI